MAGSVIANISVDAAAREALVAATSSMRILVRAALQSSWGWPEEGLCLEECLCPHSNSHNSTNQTQLNPQNRPLRWKTMQASAP